MWKRLIDVAVMKPNGESILLVNHKHHPNTFACTGDFERFAEKTTQTDTLTISLFNLPAATRGIIALGGYSNIVVNFGYQDELRSLRTLFKGQIRRITNSRPDAITHETKLFVYDTGEFQQFGFFEGSYASDVNYYSIFEDALKNTSNGPENYYLAEALKNRKTISPFSLYGSTDAILQEATETLGFVYKKDDNGIKILDPESIYNETKVLELTRFNNITNRFESASGLIGIPKLTDSGLEFETLLLPELRTYDMVHIDNSIVSVEADGFEPNYELGANLDANGLYVVTSIKGKFSNTTGDCKLTVTALSRDFWKNYVSGGI